ncbi:MAG: LacI family DNA-binding transcriptional regulator [Sphingomicrobium sp.]
MVEATIRDVARRAQVSTASVSRALNGVNNVSEETRSRVLAAATDLGYVPHAGARSLSLARTNAIGVVLPDVHGAFFSEIVRGMDSEASKRGYLLLLSNMHGVNPQPDSVLRAMRGRVDGLLVMAPHLDAETLIRALPATTPTVLINGPGELHDYSNLRLDNGAGVDALICHLTSLGRRRIIHLGGPRNNVDAQERAAAFRSAMERYAPGEDILDLPGDFTEKAGEETIRRLLSQGVQFDAVFAANDMMAIGVLQALKKAGLQVPADVAVAGFDDVPLARHLDLTTVRARIAELGVRAIARLVEMLGNGDPEPFQELHSTELVVRGTTDPRSLGRGPR